MDKKDSRRLFLKKLTVGGLAVSAIPGQLTLASEKAKTQTQSATSKEIGKRRYNSAYAEANLNRIAFPIGGIGAGMFCIEGVGALSHMSIRNKPQLFHEPAVFAAIAVQGIKNGAKVLEGSVPEWKLFGQRGTGNGAAGSTYGLPRFSKTSFEAKFPFCTIHLADEEIPLKVEMTGWSPFIPNNEDDSSLPVGAIAYHFHNTQSQPIEAVFSYNAKNFVGLNDQSAIKPLENGFILTQPKSTERPEEQAELAIFTDQENTVVDHCWFKGGWWDPLTIAWNTVSAGKTRDTPPIEKDAPGASLFIPFSLGAGEQKTIRLHFAWYVPFTKLHIGDMASPSEAMPLCDSKEPYTADKDSTAYYYRPWYSSKFDGITAISNYWRQQYDRLQQESALFRDALFASTFPPEVMEAVTANLSILKSPTVMRQHDGKMWNWEGCGDDDGCCHGSCTHVWNYAQAIPHLFPRLERSLRHTEFCENQNAEGHQNFRANTPISPAKHDFHAAADGQLGGIMKVYRDWRISGDIGWLKDIFPLVKRSMDYCIKTWDPEGKGVVEEPHHNTYDIEFWGPDGMCTSFYLGALLAMQEMGKYLKENVSQYKKLYQKGREYMETKLYDGEYFIQEIKYKDLHAPNPATAQSFGGSYSPEAQALLEKEGPKYQYGKGCLSDGILGAWIATMCGLPDPVDTQKIKSHLQAVHRYNLKKDLSDHPNPQRPSYAAGKEGGLLLCTWPKGGKLSLPFVYSDEVWTGIEYQVASHLLCMGAVNEGLEVVRLCRDRYDGRVRNPFNEYECGSWYGRALSSYGLIQGLTGLRYDAVDKTLYMDSKVGDFKSFIATAGGFGVVHFTQNQPRLEVIQGEIPIAQVKVSGKTAKLATV
ncbi:non-lysosomal glucosylceramidase [Olivibacter ginsenosidimutans]|uniref:Non-lysosomal glucosylceramidase n=1 Tax=Olivibacter ginsenosidimutans TaxID=1176537 RepID=A0ABP9BWW6_9SPHI